MLQAVANTVETGFSPTASRRPYTEALGSVVDYHRPITAKPLPLAAGVLDAHLVGTMKQLTPINQRVSA